MMACPVCAGAFSWKDDLLRHFGAIHRLEGLVSYLESEFQVEPCPDKCRVPRLLFKDLLPHDKIKSCLNSSVEPASDPVESDISDDAEFADEYSEHGNGLLDLSSPSKKFKECSDQLSTCNQVGNCENMLMSKTQFQSGGESVLRYEEMDPIQRFHCDVCDFSANNPAELIEHITMHKNQTQHGHAENRNHFLQRREHRNKKHCLRYKCDLCPFASSKSQNLRRHANIHIKANTMMDGFRCGYCSFAHNQRRCIIFHLSRYHSDQPVRFSSLVDGEVIDVTTSIPQKSSRPPMKFASDTTVNDHVNSTPTQIMEYLSHSISHTPDRSLEMLPSDIDDSLALCDVSSLEQQLPLSMIYSSPVKCPACDFTNRVRVNLVRHIHLYHGDNSSKHKSTNDAPGFLMSQSNISVSHF